MLKVEQADRDVAAAITGDEAMAYGMSDLSDAVQRVAKHREDTALPLREVLEAAFDFLGGVDGASEIRHTILKALSPDTTGGE